MTVSLKQLRDAFAGRLLTEPQDTAPFLTDWRKKWTGRAHAVAQPDTTQDVANVVAWCAANAVPVVPQGGNTGMSGAATPDSSGHALVVSLARLNRIRAMDTANNTIVVEAGCVLQTIQEHAKTHARLFPLSLAPQGSCMIGGNLATNAGGTNVLRYGNARELCLGLEVVTAQGEIWHGLRGLRKDNTGYDLRDLFIGSEGTLGIITAATLKLFPLPRAKVCAWVAVESLDHAVRLLEIAQERLSANLSGFEVQSAACFDLLEEQLAPLRWPMDTRAAWGVLLEISDFVSEDNARVTLEALLELAFERALIVDGVIAQSLAQSNAFWALRENMSEAQLKAGKNIKHDISIPISHIPQFVRETDALITGAYGNTRMIVFGHLGDGNLHYNVSPKTGDEGESFTKMEAPINTMTHDQVAKFNGSVSAEHGLGVLRRFEAARFKSPVEIAMMRAIKTALDPLGIMNPGKALPVD
jgi:FAD/FMN-containing dehydrogenase